MMVEMPNSNSDNQQLPAINENLIGSAKCLIAGIATRMESTVAKTIFAATFGSNRLVKLLRTMTGSCRTAYSKIFLAH